MKNISTIKDCYGCGVCTIACPKKIISIRLNEDGFYEPYISQYDKCINCGICLDVCAYSHDNISQGNDKFSNLLSYGAWSKDENVRQKCSSGGVGFELGLQALKQGIKVCCVRYNTEKNIAEHYIATNEVELVQSIGSKYIQSYTVDGFKLINKKERYLITGTPCQIDSFRRYTKKYKCEENFILMDFFCHGVPSMLVWKKYSTDVERKIGKLSYVSWRNKITGWHGSCSMDDEKYNNKVNWHSSYNILIKGKKSCYNSSISKDDSFYRLFFSDLCLGCACYNKCKYKYNKSSADIRIGDAWGEYYRKNEEGVSVAISFSEKGDNFLKSCNINLENLPFNVVCEGQMKSNVKKTHLRMIILMLLKTNMDIKYISKISYLYKRMKHYKRAIEKRLNLL